MTESPRAEAPEAVDRLWSTIEDYCEIHDRHRRPVRRIAGKTGLSRSTISDWFNYRSFPQWEPFAQFLGYFKDDDLFRRDLEVLWKAAWDAHQTARGRDTKASRKTENRARLSWAAIGLVAIAIAVGAFVALRHPAAAPSGESTAPAVRIVGGLCMTVTANDVRVFVAATGEEVWTSWPHDTKFWADRDAGSPNRYRTTLRNGRHGWVTNDPRYVRPADGCA